MPGTLGFFMHDEFRPRPAPSYARRVALSGICRRRRSPTSCSSTNISRQTAAVTIVSPAGPEHDVVVFMEGGEIVDARFGDIIGVEAVRRALRLREGEFHVDSERHHREANRLRALQQAPARGDGVRRRGEQRRTQRCPRRGPGGNHDSEVAAPAPRRGSPIRSSSSARRRSPLRPSAGRSGGARSRKPPRWRKSRPPSPLSAWRTRKSGRAWPA